MKKLQLPALAVLALLTYSCVNRRESPGHIENAEHSIIYYQPGRFAGWPANCGAYLFENDEIVVGFTEARYKLTDSHNAESPYLSWLARSTDGGKTWESSDPEHFVGDFGKTPELNTIDSSLNFKHPGFAMRVVGNGYHGADDGRGHFFYTYDKGITWQGPHSFGDLLEWPELKNTTLNELTPRTDYIVTDEKECILFFAAREKNVFASDRLFCVKTTDGGKTFAFLGWVVGPAGMFEHQPKVALFDDPDKNPNADQCRAVMSQSMKLDGGSLLSVIRRKFITADKAEVHWIDAYQSTDEGKTWHFSSKIADTGGHNGNPPSLAKTKDGRLCVVYGERNEGTIRVTYSTDNGKTWSKAQILMEGFWSEDMELNDLGYPRVVCLRNGKMVAMYYYSTRENPHHLRATTWEP